MRDFAKFNAVTWLRELPVEAGIALLLGIALAWVGPFNTYEQAFLPRVGYWTSLTGAWFVLTGVVSLALRRAPRLHRFRAWQRNLITLAVSAIPMVGLVAPATSALIGWRPSASELSELYGQVMLLGAGISLICNAIVSTLRLDEPAGAVRSVGGPMTAASPEVNGNGEVAPTTSLSGAELPRLEARLPPHMRGPILCLGMEDHYVRVHTDKGSSLILFRLVDAIEELDDLAGARVHRSWWVAAAAVSGFTRSGRTAVLTLVNGLTVPVSQPYLAAAAEIINQQPSAENIESRPVAF